MIRDSEEYQTEIQRLSVERERLRLEQFKQELQLQRSLRRSVFLGATFGLGIMSGVGIFALLEKLPAIIEAIKH